VITAASADRNSFGCSNEADFTYFGKAYFDEALRKTSSFTEAFELAAPEIAARERKEGYDPSDPQMSVGRDIVAVLAPIEKKAAIGVAPSARHTATGSTTDPAPHRDE